jgi:uncharacterized protein (DUF2141 family)
MTMNDRHRKSPNPLQIRLSNVIHSFLSRQQRPQTCLGVTAALLSTVAILGSLAEPIAAVAQSGVDESLANSQLVVEVDGVRKQAGQMCLSVFESDRGFPGQSTSAVQNKCVAVTPGPQTIQVQGLKPGSYAVAVLHDANGDQKANRNGLGIPIEGFGFSRNPTIRFRVPRFKEAAIAVTGKQTKIQIRLNHF